MTTISFFVFLLNCNHTMVMPISPGTHPASSPYSSTKMLPRYRKQEWGLVPYTLTICSGNKRKARVSDTD